VDANGRIVKSGDIRTDNSMEYVVDVSELNQGVYVAILQNEKGTAAFRFVKQ
jgi:hypothetical protein